jgi:hypothetical protein
MPEPFPTQKAREAGPEERPEGNKGYRRHEPSAEPPRGACRRHLPIRERVQQSRDVIADVLRGRIGPKGRDVQLTEPTLAVYQPPAIATGSQVALEGGPLLFGRLLVKVLKKPGPRVTTDHTCSWV